MHDAMHHAVHHTMHHAMQDALERDTSNARRGMLFGSDYSAVNERVKFAATQKLAPETEAAKQARAQHTCTRTQHTLPPAVVRVCLSMHSCGYRRRRWQQTRGA